MASVFHIISLEHQEMGTLRHRHTQTDWFQTLSAENMCPDVCNRGSNVEKEVRLEGKSVFSAHRPSASRPWLEQPPAGKKGLR